MKLCLLSPATDTDHDEAELRLREKGHTQLRDYPLGVLTLAAELQVAGFVPSVFDLNILYVEYLRGSQPGRHRPFSAFVADRLIQDEIDIVGLSTICNSYPLTLQIARDLKQRQPGTVVILGGPQASVVDEATMREMPAVDFILRGEADHTFPALLARLQAGLDVSGIAGLTYRHHGQVCRNPDAPVVTDLDQLPIPAFDLLPRITNSSVMPLEHGRGCPFACTFCSTNDFFRRRFRLKSSARMIADMDALTAQYEVDYFDLMHDMFTVDRRRVAEFCEAMLESGRNYRWGCSARTDFVDEELLELMASAGCVSIFFGVESGSAETQKFINKNLDIQTALQSVRNACRHRMKTVASTIIGFPPETRQDVRATLNFLADSMRYPLLDPHLHLLAPLAGTPLQRQFQKELALPALYADLSHSQCSENANDRAFIAQYPELFPNFYALPTANLKRAYLEELREFMMRVMTRFRWTVVAWFQRCGDVLALFDDWKKWASENQIPEHPGLEARRYYCKWQFDQHFLQFLASRSARDRSPFEEILLRFERQLQEHLREPYDSARIHLSTVQSDMRVALEDYTFVFQLEGDVQRVVELLEQNKPADDTIRRATWVITRIDELGSVELLRMPDLGAQFLSLCDGSSTVDEVLHRFTKICGKRRGMPPWEAATMALRTMYQERLIRVLPSAA